jgi:hypothetical protein
MRKISVEDFSTGLKRVRRVPLVNPEGEPVDSVAQAIAAINALRTHRSEDTLPKFGRTPTFTAYANTYLTNVKAGNEKKASTIEKEEHIIDLWKNHLGGIRIDKIRPAHVASMMNKRLASGVSERTAKLPLSRLPSGRRVGQVKLAAFGWLAVANCNPRATKQGCTSRCRKILTARLPLL